MVVSLLEELLGGKSLGLSVWPRAGSPQLCAPGGFLCLAADPTGTSAAYTKGANHPLLVRGVLGDGWKIGFCAVFMGLLLCCLCIGCPWVSPRGWELSLAQAGTEEGADDGS